MCVYIYIYIYVYVYIYIYAYIYLQIIYVHIIYIYINMDKYIWISTYDINTHTRIHYTRDSDRDTHNCTHSNKHAHSHIVSRQNKPILPSLSSLSPSVSLNKTKHKTKSENVVWFRLGNKENSFKLGNKEHP